MIILKRKDRRLYFISPLSDLNGEIIKPKVPNNLLTNNKIGNYKTPRICLYPSIDKALMAMSQELSGKELFVYLPRNINFDSLYKPDISEVPNCLITDEFWYLDTVHLSYFTKIKVEKRDEEFIYHYGNRSSKGILYSWKWTEVLNPWEKSKLN